MRLLSASKPSAGACWVLLLTALAWLPAVFLGGWALDDRELLEGSPVITGDAPATAAFARDYFEHLGGSGAWRPLAALSLRWERALFGEWVAGYHLGNLLLHLLVVALALFVLRRLCAGDRAGRVAATLGLAFFALHPALADSVVWISGRTSMLAALGGLAGAALLVAPERGALSTRRAFACAALPLLGALACKEDALFFAPVLVLLARTHSRRAARAAAWGAALALATWLGARGLALGAALPAATHPVLGADAGTLERLRAGGCALYEAARVTLLPADYPPRYGLAFLLGRSAPVAAGLAALLGWTCVFLLPLLAPLRASWCRRPWAWSAACAALALLPLTQLVPAGELFAPRYLYLPLLFAAPATGLLLRAAARRLTVAPVLCVLLAFLTLAYRRAEVYASPASWHEEVLRHQPEDARSWNALGLALQEDGRTADALAAYHEALRHDPRHSKTWSNLGRLQLAEGDLAAGEESLRRAAREGPENAIAQANLGSLLARLGRPAEAVPCYRRATELAPGLLPAWRGLALELDKCGEREAARAALLRALELAPGDERTLRLAERLDAP